MKPRCMNREPKCDAEEIFNIAEKAVNEPAHLAERQLDWEC